MNTDEEIRCIGYRTRRRGIAIVSVIVLFVVCATLFGLWAKLGIRARQRMVGRQFRLQAERLAEAGMQRAVARHATDPQYRDETWQVPADWLGGTHSAEVRIRVQPAPQAPALRYTATSVYPTGVLQHAEITRTIDIPESPARDNP